MRKEFFLILLFLLLVACGQGGSDGSIPTPAQPADTPRELPTPTPSLPATWTPAPVLEGQHLPGVGGATIVNPPENSQVDTGNQRTHVVQPGDTLGEIATQYGVSLDALAKANNISNLNVVEVGTVLIIPDG